ncbi:MAG: DUF6326 family protein [Bacteroidia bacterium]|jgi:hypothetical protein|nr:DUF6326 family protein [Bacteroidia bacterium]
MKQPKELLFTLWIFVMFNYLYCDVMGLMDSSLLRQYLSGTVGGMPITENFLLLAAIVMEIPIAMILLTRLLAPKANARANLFASAFKTLVMLLTLFAGSATSYYWFCAVIEIATTLFIFGYSLRWLRMQKV